MMMKKLAPLVSVLVATCLALACSGTSSLEVSDNLADNAPPTLTFRWESGSGTKPAAQSPPGRGVAAPARPPIRSDGPLVDRLNAFWAAFARGQYRTARAIAQRLAHDAGQALRGAVAPGRGGGGIPSVQPQAGGHRNTGGAATAEAARVNTNAKDALADLDRITDE